MEEKEDFRIFVWHIFKHYLYDVLLDPTPVQYDIAAFLSQHRATHKVIMAFRGIGKTYITALYCMWRLWRDPTLSILIVSASKDHANKIATFIWRLMKEVPFLQHLDPDKNEAKGARTSRLNFDVCGSGNKVAPSVKAVGITGQITGSRADIILADDIEIPNNSDTPLKRDKLRLAVEEFEAILRTGQGKEVIFLGTPQSEDSVYTSLNTETKYGFNVRIWPAEYPEDDDELRYYGSRLAPSVANAYKGDKSLAGKPVDTRFDLEALGQRKALYGRSGYALQFKLNTRLSDALKYPLRCRDFVVMDLDPNVHPEKPVWASGDDSLVKYQCPGFEGDAFFRPGAVVGDWIPYGGAVMAVDPSGKGHDETAYCVLKWGNGYMYILDIGGVPGGYEEDALIKLAQVAKKWDVRCIVPERNFGGGMFAELLRPVLRREFEGAYIPPVNDLPHHNKQKELRIIETVEPVMNMHRVIINASILASDRLINADVGRENATDYQFFHQLTRLTRDRGSLVHDDRLDAFSIAVAWAQKAMGIDPDINRALRAKEKHDKYMDEYDQGSGLFGGTKVYSSFDSGDGDWGLL